MAPYMCFLVRYSACFIVGMLSTIIVWQAFISSYLKNKIQENKASVGISLTDQAGLGVATYSCKVS